MAGTETTRHFQSFLYLDRLDGSMNFKAIEIVERLWELRTRRSQYRQGLRFITIAAVLVGSLSLNARAQSAGLTIRR